MSTPEQPAARNFDLIAFDLDGTVFDSPTHQVMADRVYDAFQAAHDAGAVIAVASGRPAWMLGEQIPVAPWLDFAITCNGARVSGTRRSDLDFDASFERSVAEKTLAAIAELGGCVSIHTSVESIMENAQLKRMGKRLRDEGGAAGGNPIEALLAAFGCVAAESALEAFRERPEQQLDKVDCTMPSAEAADVLEKRLRSLGGVGIARLNINEFELTAAAASKGDACEELCRRLGIDPSRAVAFGDSGNDLSMSGRAITFVAMGNAPEGVKAAADDVTDPVTEDGVATWLEAHLLA